MEMNFKIPKMKFGKIKMNTVEDLDKIDYEKIKKENCKKCKGPYEHTNYKTVKEFFYKSAKEYADSNGIKIINCTRGGMLEVFPRMSLEEVLGKNV